MLRTEVLAGVAALEQIRPQWDALLAESPSATVFQSSSWLLTFAKIRRRKVRTIAVHEGNDLVGLYPLELSRQPWLNVRPLGVGPSDYLGPLLRDDATSVATTLYEAIQSLSPDVIDLHQIRETNPMVGSGSWDTRADQAQCLVLELPATWDEYVRTLNKSLRYEVRRPAKEPYLTQGARIEVAESSDAMVAGFQRFLVLHQRRWRKRGLPGAFALPHLRRLHEQWLPQAARENRAFLLTLWLNSEPLGVIYCMRTNRRTYFYQSGFDPNYNQYSPGTVLVSTAIRTAIERGDTEFDFLRGDEPYKMRWQPQHRLANLRLMSARRNPAGAVGSWAKGVGSKVEHRIRTRLEGKGQN